MPFSQTSQQTPTPNTLLQAFLQVPGLPFEHVLTAQDFQHLFARHELANDPDTSWAVCHADFPSPSTLPLDRVPPAVQQTDPQLRDPQPTVPTPASACPTWTPLLTLWTFLQQVLAPSKSCLAATLRSVVLLTGLGGSPCSENPGAYSKARGRLPLGLLQDLTLLIGERLEQACPDDWRWLGHRVLVADGWTVTLPDTPDNQQSYPQPTCQKKGLGFPIVRMVGLFALATQVVVGVKWGPCQGKETGETALLRDLFDQLRPGDVIVADRYYCSYFMIVLLQQRGVQVVFHLHQRRKHTFGEGRCLGEEDEIVVWKKPEQCPQWLDNALYEQLPETVEVRMVAVRVQQRGFRVQQVRIATTLLDAQVYSKEAIVSVYRDRWAVEGMIRNLKTTMSMEALRCKTAAMVHKEIWAFLLGYNLVRKIMAQAAARHHLEPWQISFAHALHSLDAYRYALALASSEELPRLAEQLLLGLTKGLVGQRPNRVEPRQVKRRPKPYARLMKPRAEARDEILNNPQGEPRRKTHRRPASPSEDKGSPVNGNESTGVGGSGPATS